MAIPAWKTARYPGRLIFDPQIIVPLRPQLFKCETVAHSLCITYTTHHQEAATDTVALIRSSLDNEELFLEQPTVSCEIIQGRIPPVRT